MWRSIPQSLIFYVLQSPVLHLKMRSSLSPYPSILHLWPGVLCHSSTLSGTPQPWINFTACCFSPYISTSELWWRKSHSCSDFNLFQFQCMASTSPVHSHLLGKQCFPWHPLLQSLVGNFKLLPLEPPADLLLLIQDSSSYSQRHKDRESLYILLIAELSLLPYLASPMLWTPDIWPLQRMCSHTQARSFLLLQHLSSSYQLPSR